MIDHFYAVLPKAPSLHCKERQRRAWFREQCRVLSGGRTLSPSHRYEVHIVLHGKWMTSSGEPSRRDDDNIVKVVRDELFRALGLDDSHAFYTTSRKHESDVEQVEVTIQVFRG